jgi:hypothetical protein
LQTKGGTDGGGYFWETNAGTTYGAIGYGDLISANSGSSNTAITSWGAQDLLLGTNRTERLRITSAGYVGIGTTSPQTSFVVSNGGAQGLEIGWDGSTSQFLQAYNRSGSAWIPLRIQGSDIRFNISGSANEKARIDSSGRLLVGTSSARTVDGFAAAIQVEGASAATGAIGAYRTSNDQYGAYLTFGKSRSTSLGGSAVVSSGDEIGILTFCGADGTDTNSIAARIGAYVDGTPGAMTCQAA